MNTFNPNHLFISTILAFALIPLSGFATDVYLPSFPAMAAFFGTSRADIQLSLVVFVVSNGVGQLFVGSLLDAYGRYRLILISLALFVLSSLAIALTESVTVLLSMRVLQGITVAMIVVGKRAFFIDVYSGSQLRHYTSMFSIVWATAPIVAPFVGGFLQYYAGWESNFYFLALATFIILVLELVYGGETMVATTRKTAMQVVQVYRSALATPDFTISLVILGLCFANIMLFNMTSPFIIEQVFKHSAVTTGNMALVSGVAVLAGGLISKSLIDRSIFKKAFIAGTAMVLIAAVATLSAYNYGTLPMIMVMVALLNTVSGFTFNAFYTYALSRFDKNAGTISGITGGVAFVVTSVFSYALLSTVRVEDVFALALGYAIIAVFVSIALTAFLIIKRRQEENAFQLKLNLAEGERI